MRSSTRRRVLGRVLLDEREGLFEMRNCVLEGKMGEAIVTRLGRVLDCLVRADEEQGVDEMHRQLRGRRLSMR